MNNYQQTVNGYNWSGRIEKTSRIIIKRGRKVSVLSRDYGEYSRNEWEQHRIHFQETGSWDED